MPHFFRPQPCFCFLLNLCLTYLEPKYYLPIIKSIFLSFFRKSINPYGFSALITVIKFYSVDFSQHTTFCIRQIVFYLKPKKLSAIFGVMPISMGYRVLCQRRLFRCFPIPKCKNIYTPRKIHCDGYLNTAIFQNSTFSSLPNFTSKRAR